MVGLAGAVGDFDRSGKVLSDELSIFGDEVPVEHETGDAFVTAVSHPGETESQPVAIEATDELLWVWGSVYGYRSSNGDYVSKREAAPSDTTPEYCARTYRTHGWECIAGLNGSFTGVLLDEGAGELTVFTDRLGSRPMHYAVLEEGVVFSTQIQGLCAFLGERLSLDGEYVSEYFSFERALGRRTPIRGVERAHPGAVTRIDLDDGSVRIDVQWRPVHDPLDQPFEDVAATFAETFESAVSERYDPDLETGVLLSGGSDSRLITGAVPDEGVTGYHINDWRNREAKIAERIADVAGTEFTFLERDEAYYQRAVEFSRSVSNFVSWFQHGHASGYAERLREDCDVLMTGHYSDTLFKENYLPHRGLLVPGTTIEVPLYLEREIETVDELVETYLGTKFHNRKHLRAPPGYLQTDDLRSILENNITDTGDEVDHHGVRHRSAYDAGVFGESYPLTNTPGRLFFDVMLQIAPFRDPFLDVRLVELMTKLPLRYRLRKNVINASIGRVAPDLAKLPHPTTNVPLEYPFALHYVAMQLRWLADKVHDDSTPRPYYTQSSWPNWDQLLRHQDAVTGALDERLSLADEIEWIDAEQLRDDYDRHMDGEDRFDELSAFLSFASIPVMETLLETEPPAAGAVEQTGSVTTGQSGSAPGDADRP